MFDIEELTRKMGSNAQAMRALVQNVSDEQGQWKPDPDTWSMKQVMEHICYEERNDFRKILKRMLSQPSQPSGEEQREEYVPDDVCRQALDGFLKEREASIHWLLSLESPDWKVTDRWPFGPSGEVMVFSAGDVLLSWLEHDVLHLRQMIELHHAWNEKQAAPYSLVYAGGW